MFKKKKQNTTVLSSSLSSIEDSTACTYSLSYLPCFSLSPSAQPCNQETLFRIKAKVFKFSFDPIGLYMYYRFVEGVGDKIFDSSYCDRYAFFLNNHNLYMDKHIKNNLKHCSDKCEKLKSVIWICNLEEGNPLHYSDDWGGKADKENWCVLVGGEKCLCIYTEKKIRKTNFNKITTDGKSLNFEKIQQENNYVKKRSGDKDQYEDSKIIETDNKVENEIKSKINKEKEHQDDDDEGEEDDYLDMIGGCRNQSSFVFETEEKLKSYLAMHNFNYTNNYNQCGINFGRVAKKEINKQDTENFEKKAKKGEKNWGNLLTGGGRKHPKKKAQKTDENLTNAYKEACLYEDIYTQGWCIEMWVYLHPFFLDDKLNKVDFFISGRYPYWYIVLTVLKKKNLFNFNVYVDGECYMSDFLDISVFFTDKNDDEMYEDALNQHLNKIYLINFSPLFSSVKSDIKGKWVYICIQANLINKTLKIFLANFKNKKCRKQKIKQKENEKVFLKVEIIEKCNNKSNSENKNEIKDRQKVEEEEEIDDIEEKELEELKCDGDGNNINTYTVNFKNFNSFILFTKRNHVYRYDILSIGGVPSIFNYNNYFCDTNMDDIYNKNKFENFNLNFSEFILTELRIFCISRPQYAIFDDCTQVLKCALEEKSISALLKRIKFKNDHKYEKEEINLNENKQNKKSDELDNLINFLTPPPNEIFRKRKPDQKKKNENEREKKNMNGNGLIGINEEKKQKKKNTSDKKKIQSIDNKLVYMEKIEKKEEKLKEKKMCVDEEINQIKKKQENENIWFDTLKIKEKNLEHKKCVNQDSNEEENKTEQNNSNQCEMQKEAKNRKERKNFSSKKELKETEYFKKDEFLKKKNKKLENVNKSTEEKRCIYPFHFSEKNEYIKSNEKEIIQKHNLVLLDIYYQDEYLKNRKLSSYLSFYNENEKCAKMDLNDVSSDSDSPPPFKLLSIIHPLSENEILQLKNLNAFGFFFFCRKNKNIKKDILLLRGVYADSLGKTLHAIKVIDENNFFVVKEKNKSLFFTDEENEKECKEEIYEFYSINKEGWGGYLSGYSLNDSLYKIREPEIENKHADIIKYCKMHGVFSPLDILNIADNLIDDCVYQIENRRIETAYNKALLCLQILNKFLRLFGYVCRKKNSDENSIVCLHPDILNLIDADLIQIKVKKTVKYLFVARLLFFIQVMTTNEEDENKFYSQVSSSFSSYAPCSFPGIKKYNIYSLYLWYFLLRIPLCVKLVNIFSKQIIYLCYTRGDINLTFFMAKHMLKNRQVFFFSKNDVHKIRKLYKISKYLLLLSSHDSINFNNTNNNINMTNNANDKENNSIFTSLTWAICPNEKCSQRLAPLSDSCLFCKQKISFCFLQLKICKIENIRKCKLCCATFDLQLFGERNTNFQCLFCTLDVVHK